jgi:hypothetical protein
MKNKKFKVLEKMMTFGEFEEYINNHPKYQSLEIKDAETIASSERYSFPCWFLNNENNLILEDGTYGNSNILFKYRVVVKYSNEYIKVREDLWHMAYELKGLSERVTKTMKKALEFM